MMLSRFSVEVHQCRHVASVRGMNDVFVNHHKIQRFIAETGRAVAARYGFHQIATPIIENKELFVRAIGTETDVVSKELYSWTQSNSNHEFCLRPEGTAGIMRSYLNASPLNYHEKSQSELFPKKIFYAGPMFRHERPQKGRYRQFDQIGIEWIGEDATQGIACDLQLLSVAHQFLHALSIPYELQINSIGLPEERKSYCVDLKKYLEEYKNDLSDISQQRVSTGHVLRVLDSKDAVDREIIQNAPNILDYLNQESTKHFQRIQEGLDAIGVKYTVNTKLVRGLDYYNDLVFEFVNNSAQLGASQKTILAGGRYDTLSSQLSTHRVPAIGWAAGIDRIGMLLDSKILPKQTRPIAILIIHDTDDSLNIQLENLALKLLHELSRNSSLSIHLSTTRTKIAKQITIANRLNAIAAVLIGPNELAKNVVNLKCLDSKEEKAIPITELEQTLMDLVSTSDSENK